MPKSSEDYKEENYFFTEPEEAVKDFDYREDCKAIIASIVDELGLEFVMKTAVESTGVQFYMSKKLESEI